jgi:hypothetical protein
MSHACNDFCCHPPRRKWFQFEDAHHTWCEIFVFFVSAVAVERLFALRSILPPGKQCSRRREKLKCTATSAICTGQAAPKSLKHIVHERVYLCKCVYVSATISHVTKRDNIVPSTLNLVMLMPQRVLGRFCQLINFGRESVDRETFVDF